ncbi:MAG: hypothetical protein JWM49_2038 [Microbacteriaceae bacterium]|nr:hypothetical protein [Microbacteriaceae bacterium]
MTVVFTDTPTLTREDLTAALQITLGRLSPSTTPKSRALTGLVRALALGSTPAEARRALLRVDPEFAAALNSNSKFASLLRVARSSILGSSGSSYPAAAAAREGTRLRVARRLVGHLITPATAGAVASRKTELNCRVAITILGLMALEGVSNNGLDAVLCSRGFLGLQMNLSLPTAGTTLGGLVELGWIRRVATVGGTARWRLSTLTPEEDLVAWVYADTVDALVHGHSEPLADVIRTVMHPAFAYEEALTVRSWHYLMLKQLHHLPTGERLGLGRASIGKVKRAIADALPGLEDGQPLADALDEFTRTRSLAEYVKGDREINLREKSEIFRAGLQAAREKRQEDFEDRRFCRALFHAGEKQIGEVPDAGQPRAEFEAWLVAGRVVFGIDGKCKVADPGLRPAFREVLGQRLGKAGYSERIVEQAIAYVLPEPDELVA